LRGLGTSGAPQAFDVLMHSAKQESWQGIIRQGALEGLMALKDKRALDTGLEYSAPGNFEGVRVAAFQLLGETGKGDNRVLETLVAALREPSNTIRVGAAGALGQLGDSRALPALEEVAKAEGLSPGASQLIAFVINRIKAASR
jgi:HEAT repeat protein